MDVRELDVVALATDLPGEGLNTGDIGTVVHVFHKPYTAYEVEFTDPDGRTIAMVTLTADQIRLRDP
jgi:hypothetical protein